MLPLHLSVARPILYAAVLPASGSASLGKTALAKAFFEGRKRPIFADLANVQANVGNYLTALTAAITKACTLTPLPHSPAAFLFWCTNLSSVIGLSQYFKYQFGQTPGVAHRYREELSATKICLQKQQELITTAWLHHWQAATRHLQNDPLPEAQTILTQKQRAKQLYEVN